MNVSPENPQETQCLSFGGSRTSACPLYDASNGEFQSPGDIVFIVGAYSPVAGSSPHAEQTLIAAFLFYLSRIKQASWPLAAFPQ